MKKSATQSRATATLLSEIGLYNQIVKDNLQQTSLDTITQYTIKLFKDNAQRSKLTDAQYNKAVEEFNNTHGFLLLKKGSIYTQPNVKQYAYINYPFIDREGMKNAMDNYRQFVHEYNKQVAEENKAINKYNKSVVKPSETDAKILSLVVDFTTANAHLFTRQYNEAVAEQNERLTANYIPKKRIQTIKYTTELVFNVLVGFYISQLKTRNNYLLQMNRPTSVLKKSLPKLTIDQRKLATHKVADIPRLNFCKKTAQNHIKRLREAGILINYTYINQNKPIAVNFNPKIVEVLDGNPPKSKTSENHFFKGVSAKKLPDNSDTTRTFLLKEKEIKECAKHTIEKCGLMPQAERNSGVCPADGYKNTTAISKTSEICPPVNPAHIRSILPDFLKKDRQQQGTNNTITENFIHRLQDDKALAEQLANGDFDNYKGLRYDYLRKVELYANLTSEEFKAVLIQDFIKVSAKIWKQHNVYVGEWKKAINYLNDTLFKNITQKSTLIQKLQEYRWKLNFARKWFIKSNVSALYPSMYFDATRTESKEIGFFGLHKVWKTHCKYLENKSKNQQRNKTQRNVRKRKLSAQQKLTTAIKKYEAGKYTAQELFSYVQHHLPNDFLLALPNLVNNQPTNKA
ncbi:hypothetical protein [uncultured Tenacibaculum sp.]|uniref:hypothetical protein n=1 Tax=uncultured Tenacibaculum sp. TaxID=174713 RepID=UPI00262255F8|nr:hypothetical protein [uncultured Tenacibaculum sp.]